MKKTHIKRNICGRILWFVALVLCISLVIPAVMAADNPIDPQDSLSADISQYLSVSATNDNASKYGSLLLNGDKITLSASPDEDYYPTKSTVTITNSSTVTITLEYSIDGVAQDPIQLAPLAFFQESITSDEVDTLSKVIKITKITPDAAEYTPTFAAPQNGSYTVDDFSVSEDYTPSLAKSDTYVLSASAASGYKFFGWYGSVNGFYSSEAKFSYTCGATETVTAVFAPSDCATYQVSNSYYCFLDKAIEAAENGSVKTIKVSASGSVCHSSGEKEFTIPEDVDLLVPCGDNDAGVFSEKPEVTTFGATDYNYLAPIYNAGSWTSSTGVTYEMLSYSYAYCTLTVPSGTVINLKGRLNVNSLIHSNGARDTGCPHGPYGQIVLQSGSKLNVKSGGKLYCYGFITGTVDSSKNYTSGTVVADPGAYVYELFQVRDWRGGTATTSLSNQGTKSFPVSQYYIQNIETEYVIYPGAYSCVIFTITVSGSKVQVTATMVGSNGLFNLSKGYIVRTYDPVNDRVTYAMRSVKGVTGAITENGAMTLASIELSISSYKLNSANYILGLNNNITVNIEEGCTATCTSRVKLMPGAQINIAEGATMKIASGAALYIYDKKDWSTSYTFWAANNAAQDVGSTGGVINDNRHTRNMVVRYSPARAAVLGATATVKSRSYGSAQVVVNGTLIANGNVFVTAGYATATYNDLNVIKSYTSIADSKDAGKMLTGTGSFINQGTAPSKKTLYYYSSLGLTGEWTTSTKSWPAKKVTTVTHYGELDEFYGSSVRVQIPCIPAVGQLAGLTTDSDVYSSFGIGTYYGTPDGQAWYNYTVSLDPVSAITNEDFALSTAAKVGDYLDSAVTSATITPYGKSAVDNVIGFVAYDKDGNQSSFTYSFNSKYSKITATYGTASTTALTGVSGNAVLTLTPATTASISTKMVQMVLGNALDMRFAFPYSESLDGGYAIVTKNYADGRGNVVVKIDSSEWVQTTIGSTSYYYLTFSDISAKEMSDNIYVTIYGSDGKPFSVEFCESVQSYIERCVGNYSEDTTEHQLVRTMLVDMLNYGSAAQAYFDYGTDKLANVNANQDYATTDLTACSDGREAGTNFAGSRLELTNSINLQVAFNGLQSDMYAVVAFTNHRGKVISTTVSPDSTNSYFSIDDIVVADGRQPVTVTVYDSNGNVYGTVKDGVASYVARTMEQTGTSALCDLCEKIMMFSDSAYAYLHGGSTTQ